MEEFQKVKNQARELLSNRNYESAKLSYMICLQISKNENHIFTYKEKAIVSLNIAICEYELKNYLNALQFADQAISYDPTYFKSYYRKAQILLKIKDYQQALEIATQLMTKEPSKDVFELKKLITEEILRNSNMYDWDLIKNDLQQVSTEKDVIKFFAQLYNRPEDLEAYHEILDNEIGFCKNILQYSIKMDNRDQTITSSAIVFHSIKFINQIWTSIKSQLQDKRIFIPQWLTDTLINNFEYFMNNNRVHKEQEFRKVFFWLLSYSNIIFGQNLSVLIKFLHSSAYQNWFLEKQLLDTLRLFANNLRYCQKASAEELQQNCKFYQELSLNLKNNNLNLAKYINSIHNDQQFDQTQQFDTEREEIHILWEIMIMCFRIVDQISEKLKKFNIQVPDVYSLDLFYRDNYRKKDLIILIAIVGTSNDKFKAKCQTFKINDQIMNTILKKKSSMQSIDLIKYLLSLIIKEETFCQQLKESIYAEQTNKELQDYLRDYNNKGEDSQNFIFQAKYLSILFQINNKAKFFDLYQYLVLIDCQAFIIKLYKTHNLLIHDSLNLLTFIATFDDAKKIMVKQEGELQHYIEMVRDKIKQMRAIKKLENNSSLHKIQLYSLNVSLIQFLNSLCQDQTAEFREMQKQKFGINDEQYDQARQLEKKCKPEGTPDTQQYFKYDHKFIIKHNVLWQVGVNLQALKIVSEFLINYEDELTEYGQQLIAHILSRLSCEDKLIPHLLDTRSMRLVAKLCLKGYKGQNDGFTYLSKTLCQANPNIFGYKDVHILVEALLQSAKSSTHELQIFQSLLGIVQLTSLGEDICQKFTHNNQFISLQNFLLEENYYIVHAAFQVINNVVLSQGFKEQIYTKDYSNFYKILDAILEAQYERLIKFFVAIKTKQTFDDEKLVSATDFSHPFKIILTQLSILAVLSYEDKFRDQNSEQFKLLRNDEFYKNLLLISQDQDILSIFDVIHKVVCILDNFHLKNILKERVAQIHLIYSTIQQEIKQEYGKDQIILDKLQKINEFIE